MPGSRGLGAVALVAVLLLGGCSGGLTAPGGGSTETLTPVPLPEEDRAPLAASVAAGVSEDGVYDEFALVDAHATALSNRSFARIRSTTVADANGTLRGTSRRLRVAAGGAPYRLAVSSVSADRYPVSAVFPNLELYYDGDTAFYRVRREGNVSYRRDTTTPITGPVADRTGRDRLAGLLGAFEWRVERVDAGEVTRYRLVSTILTSPSTLSPPALISNPREPEMRVLVGPNGRVHRYRLRYLADYRNGTASVTRTARFLNAGDTTVGEPTWLDRARDAPDTDGASGNAFP